MSDLGTEFCLALRVVQVLTAFEQIKVAFDNIYTSQSQMNTSSVSHTVEAANARSHANHKPATRHKRVKCITPPSRMHSRRTHTATPFCTSRTSMQRQSQPR